MSSQGHGNGDAFGKILYSDSHCKCDGTSHAGVFNSNCCGAKQYTHCESFGNVVQSDRKNQQSSLVQFRLHTFGFTQSEIQVQVGSDFIEEEDEQCAKEKANSGRNPTQF